MSDCWNVQLVYDMVDFYGFPLQFWEAMILVSLCFVKWVMKPQNQTEYSLYFHLTCAIFPLVNANVLKIRVYGQVGFRKYHGTIDYLVTLWGLMNVSHLKGKGLHCFFIDINKTFDMIPNEHILKIHGRSKYIIAILWIYKKAILMCTRAVELKKYSLSYVYVWMNLNKW